MKINLVGETAFWIGIVLFMIGVAFVNLADDPVTANYSMCTTALGVLLLVLSIVGWVFGV